MGVAMRSVNRKGLFAVLSVAGLSSLVVGASLFSVSAKTVQLRYMHWGANAALQETVTEFNKTHPGIKVIYETADWGVYFQKFATMMAAGSAPDMFSQLPTRFERYAELGMLYDLTPMYKADKKEIRLDNFYSEALYPAMVKGRYYGMPFGWLNSGFVAYNRGWFKQTGITPPTGQWDLSDMLTIGKKLTKDTNGDGKTDLYGLGGPWGFEINTIVNAGGSLYDKTGTKLTLDDPNAIRALTWIQELNTKYGVVWPGGGWDPFIQQKCASLNSHVPGVIERAWQVGKKFDCAVALYPKDHITGSQVFYADMNMISIAKTTKHPKECWEFLSWFNTVGYPVAAKRSFGAPQLVPPLKSIANSDHFLKADESKLPGLDMRVFLEGCSKHSFDLFRPKAHPEVLSVLTAEFAQVMEGKKSVAQFVAKVTPQCNGLLGRKK